MRQVFRTLLTLSMVAIVVQDSPWFVRKMRAALSDLVKERGRLPHGPAANSLPVHTFSDELVSRCDSDEKISPTIELKRKMVYRHLFSAHV